MLEAVTPYEKRTFETDDYDISMDVNSDQKEDLPVLQDTKTVQKIVKLSQSHIRDLARQNCFPHLRQGSRSTYLFTEQQINAFVGTRKIHWPDNQTKLASECILNYHTLISYVANFCLDREEGFHFGMKYSDMRNMFKAKNKICHKVIPSLENGRSHLKKTLESHLDFFESLLSEVVIKNEGLIIKIAEPFLNDKSTILDDLIQEGRLGLIKGLCKYNPTENTSFSVYASYSRIRKSMRDCVWLDNLLVLKINLHEKINKINKATKRLVEQNKKPTIERIATLLDVSPKLVKKWIKAKEVSVFLSQNEEDFTKNVESETASPEEYALAGGIAEGCRIVLRTYLTPQEEKVIRMRSGMGERQDHTLEEVGQEFDVSRERVRQIEARALRKLRHPEVRRKLEMFL